MHRTNVPLYSIHKVWFELYVLLEAYSLSEQSTGDDSVLCLSPQEP